MRIRSLPCRRVGMGALAAVAVAAAAAGAALATALAVRSEAPAPQTVVVARPATLARSALTIGQVAARVSAGVVDVSVVETTTDPWGRIRSFEAEGAGFVVDGRGFVVTSAHVVGDATSITVRFKSGRAASAILVGSDASTDVAVVRVDPVPEKLTVLAFGSSSAVRVGDTVIAIGSPFGYPQSVTAGIVSAVGRTIEAPNGAAIRNAIQTDAAINAGNSGGPLLNAAGKVIGVNAQIASRSGGSDGVGFAVPGNAVKAAVAAILGGAA